MFNLKDYTLPIDLITYVILKHISYFELDSILPCFKLTSKESAIIKYKIYKQRLTITKRKKQDITEYRIEGKLHREGDLPAIEYFNGTKMWYKNNMRHRENDLPAILYAGGGKVWHLNGKVRRNNNLPEIEYANGDKFYYTGWVINDDLYSLKA